MKKNNFFYMEKAVSMLSHYSHSFLFLFFVVVCCATVLAENDQQQKISGVVRDQSGEPLPGVNVVVVGTNTGTMSNIDGIFNLNVSGDKLDKAELKFSLIGFASKNVALKGKTVVNVTLSEDDQILDEVVVVGYGTQKKATLTGAVSTIGTDELTVTPTSNVQNMLAGKLPGVRIQQRTGEPGSYDAKMDIRGLGTPLVVIDGVVREVSDFQRLEANDIESVSVLKDASAAIYGMRASNGVLLVTTRKGESGKTRIDYTGSFGFQNPSGLPDVLDAAQYAELVREADKNMGRGINTTFTEEDVARFRREGGTDWYDLAMKNLVPQTHHNVTASGSGKRTQYFLSFGYYGEDGIWKTGDLNYHRYNIRSNLSFDVTKDLKAELLIGAMSDEKNQPYKDTWEQFKAIWMLKPTETPYANNNESFPNDVMYGLNPLMITDADQSGYKRRINRTLNTTFTLTYKAPFLKGLSAKFLYAYDYKNYQQKEFQKQYTLYKYDREKDVYNSQIYSSPSSIYRKSWEGAQNQLQASLNYERLFAEKHNLKVLFLYEQSAKEEDNLWAKRNFEMDAVDEIFAGSEEEQIGNADAGQIYRVTNMGLVGRVNYDYQSKYLAEVSFRYDGSSKFAKGHRWGLFPSISLGWNISEEKFWKSIKPVISNFKVRGSYGLVGNDQIGSDRFAYLAIVNLNSSPSYTTGYGGSTTSLSGPTYNRFQNNELTWEVGHKLNVGADLQFFNSLNITVDGFREIRDNIFQQKNSIPNYLGTANTKIYGNFAKVKNTGFDLALDYGKQVNRDLSIQMKGTFTYAHNEVLKYDEAAGLRPALSQVGKSLNSIWGYVADGLYIDQADIANNPQSTIGNIAIAPGDVKYVDQPDANGNYDGKITSDDRVVLGYPTIPEIIYGFGPSVTWKNWDFSFFFQGQTHVSLMMSGFEPFGTQSKSNVLKWIADDHWSKDNQNPNAKYPRLTQYNNNNNTASSSYWLRDASFLKLRNAEIGYRFKWARIYVNGSNLLTFSPFKLWDPEMGGGAGMKYPTQRTYNVGIQLTFK